MGQEKEKKKERQKGKVEREKGKNKTMERGIKKWICQQNDGTKWFLKNLFINDLNQGVKGFLSSFICP